MPVTAQEFRRMALSFPETEARSHMDHPDFRAAGKVFATLGYPDKSYGMVKLTPIEQQMFVNEEPKAFSPCSGKWGLRGATNVKLSAVKKTTLRRALAAAWNLGLALAKPNAKPKSKNVVKRREFETEE
jgi:hypothetical protein